MRKLLTITAVVPALLLAMTMVSCDKGGPPGTSAQERFYKAATSDDVEQLWSLMDPALSKKIDKPVLAAWMKDMHKVLGEFKGLSMANWNTSIEYKNGAKLVKSSGTVTFTKGEGTSDLVYQNDKLVSFSLKTEIPTGPWWQDEGIVEMCKGRGQEFLNSFLTGTADETFDRMHEVLQKELPKDKLTAMMTSVRTKAGALQSITFDQNRWPDAKKHGPTLEVYYKVQCAQAKTLAKVKFQFKEMAAILTGFDLNTDPPTP